MIKFTGGAKYLSSFFKVGSKKQTHEERNKQKHNILLFVFSVLFIKVIN